MPDPVALRRLRAPLTHLERLTLIGLAAGLLAEITAAPQSFRLVVLLVFLAFGPGGATLTWFPRLPTSAIVALTPTVGLTWLILLTTPAAANHLWHPRALLALMIGLAAVSVSVRIRVDRSAVEPSDSTVRRELLDELRRGRPAIVVLVAGLLCWATSLADIGDESGSSFGLLRAASPLLAVGLFLTGVGGLLAIRGGLAKIVLVAAVQLVVVERLSASIATSVPMYPWTYKHVAVSDFVDRFGFVNRATDIYQGWPGLFTSSAWLTRITGVTPIGLAHWFTPMVHLLAIPLMFAVARAWGAGPTTAAASAFLFELLSFVAQDYYSPQALAYVLALGLLTILGLSQKKQTAIPLAVLLFAAIVVTHQLTPYWLILATGGLVLARRIRPFWLPIVFAAMAGGYLLINYSVVHRYGGLVSTDPLKNVRLGTTAIPVFGIRVGFYLTEGLYAVLFGGAAIRVVYLFWRRQTPWGPAILAFSPLLILLFQGYGGEAIFRVYLYALPGLILMLGPLVTQCLSAFALRSLVMGSAVAAIVLASAQVYFGSWYAYRVSPSEVALTRDFDRLAPAPAYFTPVGPGWPSKVSWHYVSQTTKRTMFDSPVLSSNERLATDFTDEDSYTAFMTLLLSRDDAPTFVAFSDQSAQYDYLLGITTRNALDTLKQRMMHDPRWTVVAREGDAVLFRLAPAE